MRAPDPRGYASLIFDCDGVLLDSNAVKTRAFYQAALPYGSIAAERLVTHHKAAGGVSRYKKFRYFLDSIVEDAALGPTYDDLLHSYACAVRAELENVSIAPGLQELRTISGEAPWIVVSGSDQGELRDTFYRRGLSSLFCGVFGSPDTKFEILERELEARTVSRQSLFLGDSRYDHEVASAFGLDFVFISGWTEFTDWQDYCRDYGVPHVPTIADLIST